MLILATIDASGVTAGQSSNKKGWETTSSLEVKQLTEEDLPNYTIFDIVMPLPGWNVDYPSGAMGQLYFDIMTADGLDPNRMRRDQRLVLHLDKRV